MYEESIVPATQPGGGGFAVMQFSLMNLYTMFQKCSNWWTYTNENYPLCKYKGCTLKLYQSEKLDYIVKWQTQYPFKSNKLTYPSCQPGMMLLSNNKIIIPSKKTQPRKHPYKRIRIGPPPQFTNKWYFQKDISNKPLLLLHIAACDLDHYYISPDSESNNITIHHLNTKLIQNRFFATRIPQAWHYKQQGTLNMYMYFTRELGNIQQVKIKDIIPLTNARQYTIGTTQSDSRIDWQQFKNNWHLYWGNPFMEEYTTQTDQIYITSVSPDAIKAKWNNENTTIGQIETGREWTKLEEPIFLETRYNPNKDTGAHNKTFLLSNQKAEHGWESPGIPDIELDGFPLYLLLFGYTDFQKRLGNLQGIDNNYILCFHTEITNPIYNYTFVILDETFRTQKSPYQKEPPPNKTDQEKWYPQLQYQTTSLNNIIQTGPGTPKAETFKSEEIKCEYKFKWIWGGSPAKMTNVENPTLQAVYPIPSNEHATTSLQSPAQAFETMLYSFDERNFQLTKRAAERIIQNWDLTKNLLSITDTTRQVPAEQTLQTLLNETPQEEKETQTLQSQLQQLRQHQIQLRLRILQLITNSTNV